MWWRKKKPKVQSTVFGDGQMGNLTPDNMASMLCSLGVHAWQTGEYDRAIMMYQKSIECDPQPATLFNLAVCYDDAGRHEEAVEALRKYYKLSCNSDEARRAESMLRQNGKSHLIDRAKSTSRPAKAKSAPQHQVGVQGSQAGDTDSCKILMDAAVESGILPDREWRFIPEITPVFSRSSEMFFDLLEEDSDREGEYSATLLHHSFCYLFAKAVEAVILWGHSPNGHISIYYEPKDMIREHVESEVPEPLQPIVTNAMKLGEKLFFPYDKWIQQSASRLGCDLGGELRSAFDWVPRIGVSHGLAEKHFVLWPAIG